MTLIIGASFAEAAFVISDMRVSESPSEGRNTSLKTGLLAPGCIYGLAGDAIGSREFILAVRARLEASRASTAGETWDAIRRVAADHRTGHEFEAVLSTRHSGRPELFVFDSVRRKLERHGGSLLLKGSGAHVIAEGVSALHRMLLATGPALLARQHARETEAGYLYCLKLIERSQGEEVASWEAQGFGGPFHFLWQDGVSEGCQEPAIYLLNHVDEEAHTVETAAIRIARAPGFLVCWNSLTNETACFADTAAATTSPEDVLARASAFWEESLRAGPYRFCGMGFSQERFRRACVVAFHGSGPEWVVARGGTLTMSPEARLLALQIIQQASPA